MSKQNFEQAKGLIERGKYKEARRILETIEHPTAERWLAKLDTLEFDEAIAKKKTSTRRDQTIVILVIIFLIVVGGIYLLNTLEQGRQDSQDAIDEIERDMESTRQARQMYEQLGLTPPTDGE